MRPRSVVLKGRRLTRVSFRFVSEFRFESELSNVSHVAMAYGLYDQK